MNRKKPVVDMDEGYFRMVIRDENAKSWKDQKKEFDKAYMSKGDCLSIHQGRHAPAPPEENGKPDDPLKMAKAKFWLKLTGFVTALILLIGTITTILTVSYLT